jgi:hypothetical protein
MLRRAIRELLAPAPDPRRGHPVPSGHDLEQLLEGVRSALVLAAAGRTRLDAKANELRRRLPGSAELELLESQLHAADLQVDRLERLDASLTARLEAFAARGQMLELRLSAAEARVTIGEALAGLSGELGAFDPHLAEAEDRAEAMEARAEAIESLLDGELRR